MKIMYSFTGKILTVKNGRCSQYGNPKRYIDFLYDGEIIETKTATDSSAGYAVDSSCVGKFASVRGHYTKKGNFIADYIEVLQY